VHHFEKSGIDRQVPLKKSSAASQQFGCNFDSTAFS
jgi:hypothetical protein